MSMSMSQQRNRNRNIKCKVCYDSGKPEKEYNSHFTRETADPKSKVVCPTLCALRCRYCNKPGHTLKYCSVMKEDDRIAKKKERLASLVVSVKVPVVKTTNRFDTLVSDSEDDAEVPEVPETEFPTLSPVVAPVVAPVTAPVAAPVVAPVVSYATTLLAPPTPSTYYRAPQNTPQIKPVNWCDSDDESDYDDNCDDYDNRVDDDFDETW